MIAAAALLGSVPIAASATAPRAGSACTKAQVGRVSGALRCTKVGAKYRWTSIPPTTTAAGVAVQPVADFATAAPDQLPPQWPAGAPLPAGFTFDPDGSRPPNQYVFLVNGPDPFPVWFAWAKRYGKKMSNGQTAAAPANFGGDLTTEAVGPAFAPALGVTIAVGQRATPPQPNGPWYVMVRFLT